MSTYRIGYYTGHLYDTARLPAPTAAAAVAYFVASGAKVESIRRVA